MPQPLPTSHRRKYISGPKATPNPVPDMRFKGDKELKKRADDLTWQMNFAKLKLSHWQDVDNLDWEVLEGLLKSAKADYQDLV